MDVADVIGAVESYLIRSRLAVATRGGRRLTDLGMKHLQEASPATWGWSPSDFDRNSAGVV